MNSLPVKLSGIATYLTKEENRWIFWISSVLLLLPFGNKKPSCKYKVIFLIYQTSFIVFAFFCSSKVRFVLILYIIFNSDVARLDGEVYVSVYERVHNADHAQPEIFLGMFKIQPP